jgi:drug/metabolite transporter (DMT)-like permease
MFHVQNLMPSARSVKTNFIGVSSGDWLTLRVLQTKSNFAVAASLLIAIVLWGGNNSGTKLLVGSWPPTFTGGTRFLCAGLILLAVLRWTRWLGVHHPPPFELRRPLWVRGGLSLAAYIVAFNWAVRYTSPSHVALYLGASPVWALLWEGFCDKSQLTLRRGLAAVLALAGVAVLVWPALQKTSLQLTGEVLGLTASVLWTNYGRQCRTLTSTLSGAEVSAHSMWRAGVWLMPVAVFEVAQHGVPFEARLGAIQLYCIVAGGVVAFAIWNNALQHWPTSQVLLFNNLIPLSTMTWSHFWLDEPVTSTFWTAMILIGTGVALGQTYLRSAPSLAATAQPE